MITTSAWTRRRLGELHGLPADRVHVAEPGVDAADLAPGTAAGDALLCVAAVTPDKGHDVLLDALATATRPALAVRVRRQPGPRPGVRRRRAPRAGTGCGDRVRFTGPRTGADLDRAYAAADLLVLASRAETYGMVVTEALARGVPVVATDVGGVTRGARARRDGTGRGCSSRPATRRRSAPRCGPGSTTPRCASGCARPRRSGARRCARGPTRRPTSPGSSPGARRRWSGAMSVRVSPAWLDLREPADAAARSTELAERLARHLPAGPLVIHDLGGGSGAMGRWLAPRLPGPQHWVVHDRDAGPARARRRQAAAGTGPRSRPGSPTSPGAPGDLAGADLVVASALLDIAHRGRAATRCSPPARADRCCSR